MSKDVQESELRRIIEAVEIESASTVIFDGQWFTISETERIRSDEKGCHPMVDRLQELLCARCYCRPLRIFDQHCDTHTPQGLFSRDQLEAILFQSLTPYETMYDVAPDGTAFVVVQNASSRVTTPTLTVAQNWFR